jgi:hypothetical protein
MSRLSHELFVLGMNLVLWAFVTTSFIASRAGLRELAARRAARRALLAGDPRRFRAIFRCYRQRLSSRQRRELEQCFGLFWEGAFDRALASVEPKGRASSMAIRSLAISLQIQCLTAVGRHDEARRLFDAESNSLVLVGPPPYAGADEAVLQAMLQFHEGAYEPCREKLLAALGRLDPQWPQSRLVHFYLGAVEHKVGRTDRARFHLEAAMRDGGNLFVTRWAQHALSDLFPDVPDVSRRNAHGNAPRPHKRRYRLLRALAKGPGLLLFERPLVGPTSGMTYELTVTLALVCAVCAGLLRCVDYTRGTMFLRSNALAITAPLLSFAITAVIATGGLRDRRLALRVTGAFYSALPGLLAVEFLGTRAYRNGAPFMVTVVELAMAAWSMAVFLFLLRYLGRGAKSPRLVFAALVFGVTWLVPMHLVNGFPIWFSSSPDAPEDDPEWDNRALAEFTFRQADLVHTVESALRPERAATEDIYFVGVAGWGGQDVFLHEVEHGQQLFDHLFDTSGRSVMLANDPSMRGSLPMATKLNLAHVLRTVASRMNRQEDLLFLLLTSHGNQDGVGLDAPDAPDLFARDIISPGDLRGLLDDAGIKWRVLVVSSCKSGVFVAPLQDDYTLVATAAASDRDSFGCAQGKDYTSYGRAILEQLSTERSFATAFAKAAQVISEREKSKRLTPSLPQLFVGSAIDVKLRSLEARIAREASSAGPDGGHDGK